jgi:hypothetical protein
MFLLLLFFAVDEDEEKKASTRSLIVLEKTQSSKIFDRLRPSKLKVQKQISKGIELPQVYLFCTYPIHGHTRMSPLNENLIGLYMLL